MKSLVIYDSLYGNTEQIAKAIAGALGTAGDVGLIRAVNVKLEQLHKSELVIVGSPTQGGRPTQAMQDLFTKAPANTFKGINVAAFDTRFSTKLVRIFGYAAGKIADGLKIMGGTLILPPEGFFVKGSKGPLVEGELERAASWAKSVIETQKANTATR